MTEEMIKLVEAVMQSCAFSFVYWIFCLISSGIIEKKFRTSFFLLSAGSFVLFTLLWATIWNK